VRDLILDGNPNIRFKYQSENFSGNWPYEGVINSIKRRYKETGSQGMRDYYSQYLSEQPCTTCGGQRLRPEARAVTVGGRTVTDVTEMTIAQAYAWIAGLRGETVELRTRGVVEPGHNGTHRPAPEVHPLSEVQLEVAEELLKEIRDRLKFMLDVGLYYLTLDRPAPTLSGGEGQRIRLASQIGSGLVGVMYILDEPSIGLHQRDNRRLLESLVRLRDLGNTVLVVEHDEETMEAADWIIDFGPGAGVQGGEVVFEGTPAGIKRSSRNKSLTGGTIGPVLLVVSGNGRRDPNGRWLELGGVRHHNIKGRGCPLPAGLFYSRITGVSGSGKEQPHHRDAVPGAGPKPAPGPGEARPL
jgi:excinuclease ABC subunit A